MGERLRRVPVGVVEARPPIRAPAVVEVPQAVAGRGNRATLLAVESVETDPQCAAWVVAVEGAIARGAAGVPGAPPVVGAVRFQEPPVCKPARNRAFQANPENARRHLRAHADVAVGDAPLLPAVPLGRRCAGCGYGSSISEQMRLARDCDALWDQLGPEFGPDRIADLARAELTRRPRADRAVSDDR